MKRHGAMNRIFRLVWSQVNQAWVAVPEVSREQGKSTLCKLIGVAILGLLGGLNAQAGPTGTQVMTGTGADSNWFVLEQFPGKVQGAIVLGTPSVSLQGVSGHCAADWKSLIFLSTVNLVNKNELTLRKCHPCTACCEGYIELGDELEISKETGSCTHCMNSGCNIYASRPKEPCQIFECLWLTDKSPLPNWMKPDQSRVIVTLNKFKQTDEIVMVAIQMDSNIPQRTLHWLHEYIAKHKISLALIGDKDEEKIAPIFFENI